MADEWLPMRLDLWDDPRIVKLARDLRCGRAAAVGACFRLWTLANRYTVDGKIAGYDAATIDQNIDIDGFSRGMEAIGWLVIEADGVTVPDYDKWGSQGAKRRLKECQRKSSTRKVSASRADKSRTKCGPEKRTEENRTKQTVVEGSQSLLGDARGDASDDEWGTVIAEVFDVGVNDSATAVDAARERGATPADVRAIVACWCQAPERWSYPEAALHRRLMRFERGQPFGDGWESPSDEYAAAERDQAKMIAHRQQMAEMMAQRKASAEAREKSASEFRERMANGVTLVGELQDALRRRDAS